MLYKGRGNFCHISVAYSVTRVISTFSLQVPRLHLSADLTRDIFVDKILEELFRIEGMYCMVCLIKFYSNVFENGYAMANFWTLGPLAIVELNCLILKHKQFCFSE